eukprot:TRINITY_DN55_c0_g1_i11.p1 TRINITY_DN55_c0_g1~~TRINITY_DN55_c0_g1_i11.p1  ORF type:complete len:176 (+),score=20.46 TRINITY_DN55_c0_g1_i11:1023-1550(+)
MISSLTNTLYNPHHPHQITQSSTHPTSHFLSNLSINTRFPTQSITSLSSTPFPNPISSSFQSQHTLFPPFKHFPSSTFLPHFHPSLTFFPFQIPATLPTSRSLRIPFPIDNHPTIIQLTYPPLPPSISHSLQYFPFQINIIFVPDPTILLFPPPSNPHLLFINQPPYHAQITLFP